MRLFEYVCERSDPDPYVCSSGFEFAEMAGVSVEFMIIVIISGFAVTGICPTSGGGAGSLGTVPGAKLQSHVSKIQITMAIVQMIAFAVYCWRFTVFLLNTC